MNAATPLVRRPYFDNRGIDNFGNWYRSNEPALDQYWRALGGEGPEARRDFFDFCATQYDTERSAQPARPVYARLDRCEPPRRSFQEQMQHDSGKPWIGEL